MLLFIHLKQNHTGFLVFFSFLKKEDVVETLHFNQGIY